MADDLAWYETLWNNTKEYFSNSENYGQIIGGAATIVGGALQGYAGYKSAQDELDFRREELARMERFKERRASDGNDNYGSHVANLAGGTGLLANPNYMKVQ